MGRFGSPQEIANGALFLASDESSYVTASTFLIDGEGVARKVWKKVQVDGHDEQVLEAVPVQFQVPLKDLAPGRYICQINVVDEVGRKFAFPRTPLVVQ